jgi:hypothetical protein
MTSSINVSVPPFGNATTAAVRANFASAKSEIETLQTDMEQAKFLYRKIIRTASDFGTPSSGYVTLQPNILYVLDAVTSIVLTFGLTLPSSGSVYFDGGKGTGSSLVLVTDNLNLFSGNSNGYNLILSNLSLVATGPNSKIFDINGNYPNNIGAGRFPLLLMENVTLSSSANCGIIKNYYAASINEANILGNNNGIIFDGTFQTLLLDIVAAPSNNGTCTVFSFPSTFIVQNTVFMDRINVSVASGQTALNISSSATIPNGRFRMNSVAFQGAGTYITGLDPQDNKIYNTDCIGVRDTYFSGSFTFQNASGTQNATATTGANAAFVKALGTTTAVSGSSHFTITSNRLTYTGFDEKTLVFSFSAVVKNTAANAWVRICIAKNGTPILQSICEVFIKTSNENSGIVGYDYPVSVLPNDYVELFVQSESGTPTVAYGMLTASAR